MLNIQKFIFRVVEQFLILLCNIDNCMNIVGTNVALLWIEMTGYVRMWIHRDHWWLVSSFNDWQAFCPLLNEPKLSNHINQTCPDFLRSHANLRWDKISDSMVSGLFPEQSLLLHSAPP